MKGKRAMQSVGDLNHMHSVGIDCNQLNHIIDCLQLTSRKSRWLTDLQVQFLIELLEGYVGPQEYIIRNSVMVEVPKDAKRSDRNVRR